MPERVTTIAPPLNALFRRLAGELMIVVMVVTAAIGLTQLSAVTLRPGAAPEFSDPPGSGLIVGSEVIRLWLPETLVAPAGHKFPALVAQTHQELKAVLQRRGQENLWYAITVRTHLADQRVEDISFIRYPYRQPECLPELVDVLDAVAGSPPHRPSADHAAAIVRIVPAEMSQRECLEAMHAGIPAVPHGIGPLVP
jgi:hypothetical protein